MEIEEDHLFHIITDNVKPLATGSGFDMGSGEEIVRYGFGHVIFAKFPLITYSALCGVEGVPFPLWYFATI